PPAARGGGRVTRHRPAAHRRVLQGGRALHPRARHRRSRRAQAHEEAGAHVLWPRRGLRGRTGCPRRSRACRRARPQYQAGCGAMARIGRVGALRHARARRARRTGDGSHLPRRGGLPLGGRCGKAGGSSVKRTLSPSPVSYPVNVSHLARSGLPVWLEADDKQRQALADDHDLASVESFRFDLKLAPWKGDGVRITGNVRAAITQTCVVTLEPLKADIDEIVDAILVPEGSNLANPDWAGHGELVIEADGPDMPETFSGDSVDVGALAEEFFVLAIDPYPRKEGASLPEV